MERLLVAVRKDNGHQSTEQIQSVLQQVEEEANLDGVFVVSGSAKNVPTTIESMGYRHVPCVAYELSQAVSRGVAAWSEGKEVMNRLRQFSHELNEPTAGAMRKYYFAKCSALNLRPCTLPALPSTRWGGEYRLIDVALIQMDAVNDTLKSMDRGEFLPDEITLLEEAVAVLKDFYEQGRNLSKEGVLHSDSLVVVSYLKNRFDDWSVSSSPSSQSLALSILPFFDQIYRRLFSRSSLSLAFFEPAALVEFDNYDWEEIAAEIRSSLLHDTSKRSRSSARPDGKRRRAAKERAFNNEVAGYLKTFLDFVDTDESSHGDDQDLEVDEANQSLEVDDSVNDLTGDGVDQASDGASSDDNAWTNVLRYWQMCEPSFPILSGLARLVLSSPPTSINAEKVLSESGLLCPIALMEMKSNDDMEQKCMLSLSKAESLRALSHSLDRVIVPGDVTDQRPDEILAVNLLHKNKQKILASLTTAWRIVASLKKTSIRIVEVAESGEYIRLENAGNEDININEWTLKATGDGKKTLFDFPSNAIFLTSSVITVYSKDPGAKDENPLSYVTECDNWPRGKRRVVTLSNKRKVMLSMTIAIDEAGPSGDIDEREGGEQVPEAEVKSDEKKAED